MRQHLRYLTWISIALVTLDAITTIYGLSLGFEEKNIIALRFILTFGSFGVTIATITKIGLLALLYRIYKQIIKSIELTKNKLRVCEMCYTVAVITAGLSALNSYINNLSILGSSLL